MLLATATAVEMSSHQFDCECIICLLLYYKKVNQQCLTFPISNSLSLMGRSVTSGLSILSNNS
jgi:hypothetical protein